MSRFNVRIQMGICGVGQEAAFKKAAKDEVAIKLDSSGLPGKESMAVSKGSGALIALRSWGTGEWQEMGGRVGWSLP